MNGRRLPPLPEQVRGRRAYAIEFGNEALIDSLPGVPGGSSFVGSFDREYAVEDEGYVCLHFENGYTLRIALSEEEGRCVLMAP